MARKKVIPEQDVVFEEEGPVEETGGRGEPAESKSAGRSSGGRGPRRPRPAREDREEAVPEAPAAAAEEPRSPAASEPRSNEAQRAAERLAAERAAAIQADIESRRREFQLGPSTRPPRGPRPPRDYVPAGDGEDVEGDEGGAGDNRRRKRRRRRSRRGGGGVATPGMRGPLPQQPLPPAPRGRRGRGGRPMPGGGGGSTGGGYERDRDRDRYASSSPPGLDLVDENAPAGGFFEGVLELHPKAYGFLRDPKNNFVGNKFDPFVAASLIDRYKLREGVMIRGEIIPGVRGQGPRLRTVETVEGKPPEEFLKVKPFEELTAVNPFERIRLETGASPVTMRVLDLLTPLGKGQRALIVAPPRTGKTMLLQEIANAVSINHPEMHLIVLLIDERPEEVTEMRRRVRGEVIASSMDRDVESHVRLSQLIIERGKRIAEAGGQVFILLDSITRTARAFNKWTGNTGRTMTGGLDVKAMDIPKKMFGTARRFDEGGSLTVVGTALIDTGSRMDEVIFQEFKGTGNMELVLNRQLADRRIWPALDITQSGTRREELILTKEEMDGVTLLRRSLVSMPPVEAMEQLVKTLQRFPNNREFLAKIRAIL
ncbi:MAG: transcription termination factor Rho [Planctomycetaceae bacterium]